MLYGAMNFPVRPVMREAESISRLGFDYLELAMDPPEAHHSTIRRLRNELTDFLGRKGMGLVCHLPAFLFYGDLTESLRKASVEEMMMCLEVARDLNPMKAVLHPAYVTGLGAFVPDLVKGYATESLGEIVGKARELGLVLCIENMFPQSGGLSEPDQFVEVFRMFPDLRLTLDTGHARIGGKGEKKALEFIDRFSDRLSHIHTGDNLGKQDNHLPIGAGTTDFSRIVKALKAKGYDGTVTFEVFSPDRDYLRISKEKFAAMMAAL